MALSVEQGFDRFLERLVPSEAQRNAGASHRSSVKAALEAKLRRWKELLRDRLVLQTGMVSATAATSTRWRSSGNAKPEKILHTACCGRENLPERSIP